MPKTFGTFLVDPPWAYAKTSRQRTEAAGGVSKLTGYCDTEYSVLSTNDLCELPIGKLARDDSVLMLWTTFPFVPDALEVITAWGFTYVTGLPWVKTGKDLKTISYGVGYWFRGAAELLLIGKRKKSYRTNYVGLLAPRLNHSRKPNNVYELAESGTNPFPTDRLEIFAREGHSGWYCLGNEAPGDLMDIKQRLDLCQESDYDWEKHYV